MGRKKKVLTQAEIDERKQRWWGPERNARRRARYEKDPAYRERAVQQVRESYRRARLSEGLPVRDDDCRENVPLLPQLGEVRSLRINEERVVKRLTFTADELARALGRNTQVVYRWLAADLLPHPMYEARNMRNRWQGVYTEAEVKAIMREFGRHQQTSQYYRSFHEETRSRLFAAVQRIREAGPS